MTYPIIDIETLEVYRSSAEAARSLNVSLPAVWKSTLAPKKTVKKRHLMPLDDWIYWSAKEKNFWTAKNNIFFMD